MDEKKLKLLRRLAEREKENLLCRADDVKALLSLCAELGGAKDRAEFPEAHYVGARGGMCLGCPDPRHSWTPEQWAEEWKKREMEG